MKQKNGLRMYLEKNKQFKIQVPEKPTKKEENSKKINSTNKLEDIKKSVKLQYDEIILFQDVPITKENEENLENIILATQDLISNCINNKAYLGNRDENFGNLTFVWQEISLKLQTYKLEEKIKELDNKNQIINKNQKELEKKQTQAEERNNNLVYNLLGFLTAFSIVSSVVGTIQNIEGTINIMLFIAFTILILLTTLIALHNFYKSDNRRETKLQDNYFLWKTVFGTIIILCVILGIQKIKDNIYKVQIKE